MSTAALQRSWAVQAAGRRCVVGSEEALNPVSGPAGQPRRVHAPYCARGRAPDADDAQRAVTAGVRSPHSGAVLSVSTDDRYDARGHARTGRVSPGLEDLMTMWRTMIVATLTALTASTVG